jgi:hypothetical protein
LYLVNCIVVEKKLKFLTANHQGTKLEFTVVQKLNQGTNPKKGCNFFRGSFFVTFLEKQKSKSEIKKVIQRIYNVLRFVNCKHVRGD